MEKPHTNFDWNVETQTLKAPCVAYFSLTFYVNHNFHLLALNRPLPPYTTSHTASSRAEQWHCPHSESGKLCTENKTRISLGTNGTIVCRKVMKETSVYRERTTTMAYKSMAQSATLFRANCSSATANVMLNEDVTMQQHQN